LVVILASVVAVSIILVFFPVVLSDQFYLNASFIYHDQILSRQPPAFLALHQYTALKGSILLLQREFSSNYCSFFLFAFNISSFFLPHFSFYL